MPATHLSLLSITSTSSNRLIGLLTSVLRAARHAGGLSPRDGPNKWPRWLPLTRDGSWLNCSLDRVHPSLIQLPECDFHLCLSVGGLPSVSCAGTSCSPL